MEGDHSSEAEKIEEFLNDPLLTKETVYLWNQQIAILRQELPEIQQAYWETMKKALPHLAYCASMRDLIAAYNFPELFTDSEGQDWLIAAYRETKSEGIGLYIDEETYRGDKQDVVASLACFLRLQLFVQEYDAKKRAKQEQEADNPVLDEWHQAEADYLSLHPSSFPHHRHAIILAIPYLDSYTNVQELIQAWRIDELRYDEEGKDWLEEICKQAEKQHFNNDRLTYSVNAGIVGGFAFLRRYNQLTGNESSIRPFVKDDLYNAVRAWQECADRYNVPPLSPQHQVAYSYARAWALKHLRTRSQTLEDLLDDYFLYRDRRNEWGQDWLLDIWERVQVLPDRSRVNPYIFEAQAFLARAKELGAQL